VLGRDRDVLLRAPVLHAVRWSAACDAHAYKITAARARQVRAYAADVVRARAVHGRGPRDGTTMSQLVCEFIDDITNGAAATCYAAYVYGARTASGAWEGWIVFVPPDGAPTLCTDRETVQPDHMALVRWADDLGPRGLEAALRRAQQLPPLAQQRKPSVGT
jgi:hypothetical protein